MAETAKLTPLARALALRGISANALAKMLNTSRQNVSRWALGKNEIPRSKAIIIAKILDVSAAELMLVSEANIMKSDERALSPTINYVPVIGRTQAGMWMEFEEFEGKLYDDVPSIPGKWHHYRQFAFLVSGPSMNLDHIFDGDFVICVPYFDARAEILSGETVVVERRRGATIERTVKAIEVKSGGFRLCPKSDDPRCQDVIEVTKDNGDLAELDGTTVEIVGLVIGTWRPR